MDYFSLTLYDFIKKKYLKTNMCAISCFTLFKVGVLAIEIGILIYLNCHFNRLKLVYRVDDLTIKLLF